jgi:hypothetical protein
MQWVDLESLVWVLEPDLVISAGPVVPGQLKKQLFHEVGVNYDIIQQ